MMQTRSTAGNGWRYIDEAHIRPSSLINARDFLRLTTDISETRLADRTVAARMPPGNFVAGVVALSVFAIEAARHGRFPGRALAVGTIAANRITKFG